MSINNIDIGGTVTSVFNLILTICTFIYKVLIMMYKAITMLFITILGGFSKQIKPKKMKKVFKVKRRKKTTTTWGDIIKYLRRIYNIKSIKFWIYSIIIIFLSTTCNQYENIVFKIFYLLISIGLGKYYILYYIIYYIILNNSCIPLPIDRAIISEYF